MSLTGNPFIPGNDLGSVEAGGLLNLDVASGATSGTQINVTGMKPGDKIVSVVESNAGALSQRKSNVISVLDGGFKMDGASSASHTLAVLWLKRQASA